MKKHKRDVDKDGITTALAAVALQDHLVKSLSLDVRPRLRAHSTLKPVVRGKSSAASTTYYQKNSKKEESVVELEYVLDSKLPPLTLAQRYGLVEAPKQLLTEDEWKRVKEKARQRQDFRQPCVICKEDLGTQPHVLLSCTHVFHKNCLQSFERFTGRKSCPMCRKEQYQTRVVHDGSAYVLEKSATLIQAMWRGYVVRSWYRHLRQTVPPKDVHLRAKFYEEKLKNITDRMVKSIDYDVNGFLREIDQSLEASRNVFRHFDDVLRVISDMDWQQIEKKAKERADVECSICLMALDNISGEVIDQPSMKVKQVPVSNERKRHVVLLSCSHLFHATCLGALEEFSIGERSCVCPVCRAHYQKKLITAT